LSAFNGNAYFALRELSNNEFQDKCNGTYGKYMMQLFLQKNNLTVSANKSVVTTTTTTTSTTTTRTTTQNVSARKKREAVKPGTTTTSTTTTRTTTQNGSARKKRKAVKPGTTTRRSTTWGLPPPPPLPSMSNPDVMQFSFDLYYRVYTGGCFYRDIVKNIWTE
jgi:hypothetical protein